MKNREAEALHLERRPTHGLSSSSYSQHSNHDENYCSEEGNSSLTTN